MKKRLLGILILLLFLTACQAPWKEEAPVRPMDFYYPAVGESTYDLQTGGLTVETVDLGTQTYRIPDLLTMYLQFPVPDDAAAVLPADVSVEGQSLEDRCLTLRMSEAWDAMNDMDRRLAEACLVLTMTQLYEVDTVSIQWANGTISGPMTNHDYLLFDDSATSDQVTVKLYFSDQNGRYLLEESRSRAFASQQQMMNFVVSEIVNGPENTEALSVIPEGTNLLRLSIEEGVCTLDFSEAFLSNRPRTHAEARMVVFSLVNALTELPQVERVRFLCVGQPISDYAGLDLSLPLQREEPALGQNRTTAGALDTTLYLPCGTMGKLAAIPTFIRQSPGKTGTEAVLSGLLSFKPANGYENPFPDGTMVMDLVTVNRICTVTFNSAFGLCDSDPVQAQKAVRSVVATLCELDGIESVQIAINGGSLTSVDISQPLTPETHWVIP